MDTSSASSDASVSWKSNAAEFDAVAVSAFDALASAPPTVPLLSGFRSLIKASSSVSSRKNTGKIFCQKDRLSFLRCGASDSVVSDSTCPSSALSHPASACVRALRTVRAASAAAPSFTRIS